MKKILLIMLFIFTVAAVNAEGKLPWLRAEGSRVVDEYGRPVILRGVNLGGWLVEETWMLPFETKPPAGSPFVPIKDHVSLWKVIETRFGKAEMENMRTAFRMAWLTESDFARIRAAGLNCVRLPFLSDIADEPNGLYPWLDRAIDAATKHDLYVILDMHGTPGRQSDKPHTGMENSSLLFRDPALVKKTTEMWAGIAQRYKDQPTVAGYDLMNEPMGASNGATLYLVYDQIYRAVRAHDARHLIFIEDGFKGVDHMPNPAIAGWHNVIFSTHTYARNAKSEEDFLAKMHRLTAQFTEQQTAFKVPMYLGEFNVVPCGTTETIKKIIINLQAKEISWSLWSYKNAGKMGKHSLWGLYNRPKRLKKIDPFQDSQKEIMKKIEQLYTEDFQENTALLEVFRSTIR